jgi:hypothetical protein
MGVRTPVTLRMRTHTIGNAELVLEVGVSAGHCWASKVWPSVNRALVCVVGAQSGGGLPRFQWNAAPSHQEANARLLKRGDIKTDKSELERQEEA